MKNRIILGVLAVLLSGFVVISNAQTTASEESSVTLINPFEIPADKLDATVSMWEQARDFLKHQPGYISTQLHQSLKPEAKYRLINVAKWENAKTFQTAMQKMQAEIELPRIEGVKNGPELYTVIRQ